MHPEGRSPKAFKRRIEKLIRGAVITLIRPPKPQVLNDKETDWTNALLQAVNQYGTYQLIPEKEKEKLVKHYRHDQIRAPLFLAANDKCALCEFKPADVGNAVQVEHFHPKSKYMEHCFSWNNFLPACGRCNSAKGDFDTLFNPIVDPYKENHENYFNISFLKIKPLNNNEKARLTIK